MGEKPLSSYFKDEVGLNARKEPKLYSVVDDKNSFRFYIFMKKKILEVRRRDLGEHLEKLKKNKRF
jgi:hypothetical protein